MDNLYAIEFPKGGKVNIDPFETDPFYRYKMSRLQIQYGIANGGQTFLYNIMIVCNELKCSEKELVKFISKRLSTWSAKNKRGTYLSGTFSCETISDLLIKFIQKFILCPTCQLPELVPIVKGKRCNACGERVC